MYTPPTWNQLAQIRERLGNARFHLGQQERNTVNYKEPLAWSHLNDTQALLDYVDFLTDQVAQYTNHCAKCLRMIPADEEKTP